MDLSINSRIYQVFAETHYPGNNALVVRCDGPIDTATMGQVAKQQQLPATCFYWPKGNGYQVRCFNPQQEISCCGHGLLAVAQWLLTDANSNRLTTQLYVGCDTMPITVFKERGLATLVFSIMVCKEIDVPHWTGKLCDTLPVSAATAGGDNGYLILEMPVDCNLASIAIDHELISQQTNQAVILTQRYNGKRFDFLTRYFAPQYGTTEDSVTGSAHRILADYWYLKTGNDEFTALQCSSSPGVLYLKRKSLTIELSGHATQQTINRLVNFIGVHND